ncbi:DUF1624 domain-containing protein, partial [Candidatus Micrarchaeota archaeon]|nr:DUF1624 domain-containing protein [Candidatus Micrarchaeota archaeon]MBU1930523.1 DUF1624 domain-containing protein [Candidatus Micrarchaeota archaeon]
CKRTDSAGGYSGGLLGWNYDPVNWRATEHNIDVYSFGQILYELTGEEEWRGMAQHAQEFVQSMLSLQQTIGSTTYKNQVRQQVQFNLEKNPISGEELMGTLKDRIPILQTLEEWLWLLFSLGIASLFLFLSGIILQPLGMFWGMIFQKTLGKISTAPPEKKQVEDSELKKALKKAVAQDQQTKKEPPIIEEADSQKPDKSPFETKSDGSQQDKPELFPPGTL